MRRLIYCLVVIALTGCSSKAAAPTASPTPASFQLAGTVSGSGNGDAPGCTRYSIDHATVTVFDEHGTIIGTTTTGGNAAPVPTPFPYSTVVTSPEYADHIREAAAYAIAKNVCVTTFATSVPRASFYRVKIGTHDGPPYSFDQMVQMGWKVALTLGN